MQKKLPWAALGLIAAAALTNVIVTACGSDSVVPAETTDGGDTDGDADGSADGFANPQDSGGADGFIDMIIDGGRAETGACAPVAQACTKSTECCSASCDAKSGKCANPSTSCGLPGVACTTGNTCCTGSCAGGTCSSLQCVADNAACAVSSDCCSQDCVPDGKGGGTCKPLTTKPVSGNPCTTNAQCASSWCNNGICANPSFCTVDGDICSTDQQCCGGLCSIAAGAAVGICSVVPASGGLVGGPCKPAGELCSPDGTCTGASCCSRSCAPAATSGLGVCQPESGCHIIGDLCTSTTECCGVKDLAGSIKGGGSGPSTDVQCQKASASATFGICNYAVTVCSPAGALCKPGNATVGGAQSCSTKADCCAGNDNQSPTCQIDTNGIPRCTVLPDLSCDGGKPAAGTQCASSADCCGDPCLVNTGADKATKPYVCGATCQMQGTSCTSNADCCNGLPCALPAGSASGVCGGTLLPDGGVSTTPPPGSDGGVVNPPDSGTTGTCALYGQGCVLSADCCSGVPCTNRTCHYP